MPSIDFSDVKGFEPVPAGDYLATVASAEVGTSQSGYPKITLQWKIEAGDHAGRMIFDSLAFHPNALFRVKNTLMAFGFPSDFQGDVEPEMLVGNSAWLKVVIENSDQVDPQTGEPYPPRNVIKKYSPANNEDLLQIL